MKTLKFREPLTGQRAFMSVGKTNSHTFRSAILFALFLAFGHHAEAQPLGHRPQEKLNLGGKRVEFPLEVTGRHPIVLAKINGKGPYPFVLDTAAGLTVLDKRLGKKLKLKSYGRTQVGDATGSASHPVEMVGWDSIELGQAQITNGSAILMDLQELFDHEPGCPKGILGVGLFEECLLTLDYPHKQVVLEKGSLPEPDGKTILSCGFSSLPTIHAELAEQPIDLVIDSGAATCLALTEGLSGTHKLTGDLVAVGMARRLNSEAMIKEARIDGDLVIGQFKINQPLVNYTGIRSVVGYDVLGQFVVTLDQRNERIRFEAPGTSLSIPPRVHAGFGTTFRKKHRVVKWVLSDSTAGRADLRVNDVIIDVNGISCARLSRGDWRELLEHPGEMKLTLKRGKKKIKKTLRIIPLVP